MEEASLTSTLTYTDASTILPATTPISSSRVYLTRCCTNSCRESRSVMVPILSKDFSTAVHTESLSSLADTRPLPGYGLLDLPWVASAKTHSVDPSKLLCQV